MSFNLIRNFGGRGVFITRKLIYIHAWGVWLYVLLLWPKVKYLSRWITVKSGADMFVQKIFDHSFAPLTSSGKLFSILGYTPVNIIAHIATMNLLWFNSKHQREPPNSSSSYLSAADISASNLYFLCPCIYGSIACLAHPKGIKGCNRTILGSRWRNELYPHSFSNMRTSISGARPLYLTGGCWHRWLLCAS